MADWYYSRDGQTYGPVDTATLKEMAATGQLLGTDHLWRDGMAQWMPAATASGLFPENLSIAAASAATSYHKPIGVRPPTSGRKTSTSMLHWSGIVPLVLFAVIECKSQIPLAMSAGPRSDLAITGFLAHAVGGVISPLLIGWIVWKASRSQLAATLTFSLILLGATAASYRSGLRGGFIATQQAMAEITADLKQKDDAARTTAEAATDAGIISGFDTIKAASELDPRIKNLDAAISASETLLVAGDQSPAVLRKRIESLNLSADQIEEAIQTLEQRTDWTAARKRVKSNVDYCRAGRALLAFLRDHFGQWPVGSKAQDIVLDSDAANKQYAVLVKRYTDSIKTVEGAQMSVGQRH